MNEARVICVGETLWDVLPEGECLGGAPLNVAYHLTQLGVEVKLVSRLGDDARGRAALTRMRSLGLDTSLVQIDTRAPTGIAEAVVDAAGVASYRGPAPAAWDFLETPEAAIAAARGATVVYGTLAQRTPAAAKAIERLLSVAPVPVFDANLRAPHDEATVALAALGKATFVKLNEEEVQRFAEWLQVAADPAVLGQTLKTRFGIETFCVTEGARGARLWHGTEEVRQAAFQTAVVDTIGAGDSFLAMLVAALGRGARAQDAMHRAAQLAAFVASCRGATPAYDPGDVLR